MAHPMSEQWLDWKPIETAPKTDDEIMIALGGEIYLASRDYGGGYVTREAAASMGDYPPRAIFPTHWAPKPVPPES
jgi:hypothetical protein